MTTYLSSYGGWALFSHDSSACAIRKVALWRFPSLRDYLCSYTGARLIERQKQCFVCKHPIADSAVLWLNYKKFKFNLKNLQEKLNDQLIRLNKINILNEKQQSKTFLEKAYFCAAIILGSLPRLSLLGFIILLIIS